MKMKLRNPNLFNRISLPKVLLLLLFINAFPVTIYTISSESIIPIRTAGAAQQPHPPKPRLSPETIGLSLDSSLSMSDINQLTLVRTVQEKFQQAIEKLVKTSKSAGAKGLVIGKDGSVIAIEHCTALEPGSPSSLATKSKRSSILARTYEPGLAISPLVWALAIENKLVSKDERFEVEKGIWNFSGSTLYDDSSISAQLTPAEAIRNRSKIAMAKAGLKIAPEKLAGFFLTLGLKAKCGMELSEESTGLLQPPEKWSELTQTRLPIGQECEWNIGQVARSYSSLLNNGMMPLLTLTKNVPESAGGRVQVFEKKTAEWLLSALEKMRLGNFEALRISANTPFANKGKYNPKEFMQTSIYLFPSASPEFLLLIQLEKPQPQFSINAESLTDLFDSLVKSSQQEK